jgi:hypothetical protein
MIQADIGSAPENENGVEAMAPTPLDADVSRKIRR